jgi:hypothetical protein
VPVSEVVIDVNDVTECDAFIDAAARGAKYRAWRLARARAASTERIGRTHALYRSTVVRVARASPTAPPTAPSQWWPCLFSLGAPLSFSVPRPTSIVYVVRLQRVRPREPPGDVDHM